MLKQSQQQPLPKLQQQRELAAQLPHTVQDEKDGCLMLGAGMGEGQGRTVQTEGVAGLGRGQSDGHKEAGFLDGGGGLGLSGQLPESIHAPPVPGIQPWSSSRGSG